MLSHPWHRIVLPVLALGLPGATTAWAHTGLTAQIEAVGAEIRTDPSPPDPYLRRAHLLLIQGDFPGAARDLASARDHGGDPGDLALAWARLHAARGRVGAALDRLRDLDRPEAGVFRAELLLGLGLPRQAALALESACMRTPKPSPELYLQLSRLRETLPEDGPRCALAVIARGLARLGPVPALEYEALRLERASGDPAAALARAERLAGLGFDAAGLAAVRGDLLRELGLPREAEAAYLHGLRVLDSGGRSSPARRELRVRLAAAAQGLDAGEAASGRPTTGLAVEAASAGMPRPGDPALPRRPDAASGRSAALPAGDAASVRPAPVESP